ncbi:MAG: hypothetical protein U0412_13720 [Nitrospira sp.]
MDEGTERRRIRIIPATTSESERPDESTVWMGGEASVNTQAGRYVRNRERSAAGVAWTVLGLTFIGGIALGAATAWFGRSRRR